MTMSTRGAVFVITFLGLVLARASSSALAGWQGAATLTIDPAASRVSMDELAVRFMLVATRSSST